MIIYILLMNEYLLNILICPESGAKLEFNQKTNELICYESKLAYPIENDIPIMLVDRARKISEGE